MHSKLCAGQHRGRITCGLVLPTVGIITNVRAYSRQMPVRRYICSALWAGSHPRCIPCGAAELVGIVEAPGVHSPAAREAERVIAPCRHRHKLQAARSRTGHLRPSLRPASQPMTCCKYISRRGSLATMPSPRPTRPGGLRGWGTNVVAPGSFGCKATRQMRKCSYASLTRPMAFRGS